MRQEHVFNCIGLIYSAATDSRQWKGFLEEMGECLRKSKVALVDFDFSSREGNIIHTFGYDPEYIRSYSDHYASVDPWMQPGEWYRQGNISVGEEILAEESLIETEFYNKWLEPQGLYYRMCAVIIEENSRICYLEVLRPRLQGRFTDAEQSFLKAILPHLTKAMSLNRYLWQKVMIEDVLRYQPYSILIVNKRGEVLFANNLSQDVLTEENGLCIRNDVLCTTKAHINQKLKGLIASASATSTSPLSSAGRSASGSIVLPRGGNQQPLSLVVLPMHRKLRRVIGQDNQVAIVFICSPEHSGELPCSVLTTLYGLTNAEERLLRLILDGYRLCDASDELGITQNTARTHMKHIYAKTGVERQVDLVRLFFNWNTLINQQDQAAVV